MIIKEKNRKIYIKHKANTADKYELRILIGICFVHKK
jgi:hypothetical protein